MPKARKRFLEKDLAELFDSQHGICACGCGRPLNKDEGYDLDHIIPLGIGGKDDINNTQYLRRPCHALKTFARIDGDISRIAKAKRIMAQAGLTKAKQSKSKIPNRGFDTRFKRKLNGTVVRR